VSRGAGRGTRGGGAADDGSVCCRAHAGVLMTASSVWSCNWAVDGHLGYIDRQMQLIRILLWVEGFKGD